MSQCEKKRGKGWQKRREEKKTLVPTFSKKFFFTFSALNTEVTPLQVDKVRTLVFRAEYVKKKKKKN